MLTDDTEHKLQRSAFEIIAKTARLDVLDHLLRIGKALGCDVTTAINDRNRLCQGQKLSFLCLDQH
ncbi:MAG: hypothetical protein M3Y54_08150, partial [Bacteroidota bacterium]|nr:hypothetical protein [Bacteroidota bacterium]